MNMATLSRQQLSISVIIPAKNEARPLVHTLQKLRTWSRIQEVIVVANGCTDDTERIAEHAGAHVISFPKSLGHDTGRAIGAMHANGDGLLFIDADILWEIRDLAPFVRALDAGIDLALNKYPLPTGKFYNHDTALAKRALNAALNQLSLHAASMTTTPHAIRREVLSKIQNDTLAIPPLAHMRIITAGLSVQPVHYVNVSRRNNWRKPQNHNYSTRELILGDHLQALSAWMADGSSPHQLATTLDQACIQELIPFLQVVERARNLMPTKPSATILQALQQFMSLHETYGERGGFVQPRDLDALHLTSRHT